MPNHVAHTMTFKCETTKDREGILKELLTDSGEFSLNRHVPMDPALLEGDEWYDWRLYNWGTKWDAYNQNLPTEEGDTEAYQKYVEANGHRETLRFSTAWGTPMEGIKRVSAEFPGTEFHVEFSDEDVFSSNGGEYKVKDGSVFDFVERSNVIYEDLSNNILRHYTINDYAIDESDIRDYAEFGSESVLEKEWTDSGYSLTVNNPGTVSEFATTQPKLMEKLQILGSLALPISYALENWLNARRLTSNEFNSVSTPSIQLLSPPPNTIDTIVSAIGANLVILTSDTFDVEILNRIGVQRVPLVVSFEGPVDDELLKKMDSVWSERPSLLFIHTSQKDEALPNQFAFSIDCLNAF